MAVIAPGSASGPPGQCADERAEREDRPSRFMVDDAPMDDVRPLSCLSDMVLEDEATVTMALPSERSELFEPFEHWASQLGGGRSAVNPRPREKPIIVTTPTAPYRITSVNKEWSEVCGFSASEVLGRTCRFLQGTDTCTDTLRHLHLAIERRQPTVVQLVNYKKSGQPFLNELSLEPLFNLDAELTGFAGTIKEVAQDAQTGNSSSLSRSSSSGGSWASSAAASPETSPPTEPGSPLDHFVTIRLFARGFFGRLRLVRHTPTEEVYALKVMNKGLLLAKKQLDHILSERRLLEACDHPMLQRFVGAYQTPTDVCLLLDVHLGGALHLLYRENGLPFDHARFYAASVCTALEYLHGRGIIYRDVKPENVLLDRRGCLSPLAPATSRPWSRASAPVRPPSYLRRARPCGHVPPAAGAGNDSSHVSSRAPRDCTGTCVCATSASPRRSAAAGARTRTAARTTSSPQRSLKPSPMALAPATVSRPIGGPLACCSWRWSAATCPFTAKTHVRLSGMRKPRSLTARSHRRLRSATRSSSHPMQPTSSRRRVPPMPQSTALPSACPRPRPRSHLRSHLYLVASSLSRRELVYSVPRVSPASSSPRHPLCLPLLIQASRISPGRSAPRGRSHLPLSPLLSPSHLPSPPPVAQLLVVDRQARLGMRWHPEPLQAGEGRRPAAASPPHTCQPREHRCFAAVDYDALLRFQLKPPYVPVIRGPLDTSNFTKRVAEPDHTADSERWRAACEIDPQLARMFDDWDQPMRVSGPCVLPSGRPAARPTA